MKLTKTSLAASAATSGAEGGFATVVVEDSDDLWCIYNLIDVDDEVRSSTVRKVSATKSGDASKGSSTEKRRVTLTLRATKVEYDGVADCVRLSGTNVHENDLVKVGAHHTAELSARSRLTVTKASWDQVHHAALFDAVTARERKTAGELGALVVDGTTGKGRLYALSGSTARHVASVDAALPKNRAAAFAISKLEKAQIKFFEKLRNALAERVDWSLARCVAVAGGDAARAFVDWLKADRTAEAAEPRRALEKGALLVVSTDLKAGVSTADLEPLLREPAVARLISDTALAKHAQAIEHFRQAEARDPDRVVYGSLDAASEAADRDAIDTLLVLDDKLKNPASVSQRRRFAALVQRAKEAGAHVLAYPARHVTADKLNQLGGLAAVLRFPCPDLQDVRDEPLAAAAAGPSAPAAHIEIKQKPKKPPTKPGPQPGQGKAGAATSKKKSKKPALNYAQDDDYREDDYYCDY